MPHAGQNKAILGTLRGEGVVKKKNDSLYVDPSGGGSLPSVTLRQTEANIERITEDGTQRSTE